MQYLVGAAELLESPATELLDAGIS